MALPSNSSDAQFGPAYHGPVRSFDFTLFFEDTILTIVPSTIFLLAAGTRAVWLTNSPNKVSSSLSRSTKLGLLSAYAAVQSSLLIARATSLEAGTQASVAAATLDLLGACVLFLLSLFEHSRSITPSTIICLYLLITLPFDVARLRTFYLLDLHEAKGIANLLSLSLAFKFAALVGEAVEKRGILLHPYQELPPEATSGIYNTSLFWWLNPLLKIGFGKTLRVEDLFNLDPSLASTYLKDTFTRRWASVRHPSRFSLLWATGDILKWQLLVSALPRLLLSGVKFAQPFLITETITYVGNRESQSASIGWALVGAYFLVYFSQAILMASYQHLLNRCTTQIRGGLILLLYQKTLHLSIASVDPSAALTLMSADVQRMVDGLAQFHDAWCSVIDVGIAMFLLYRNLGSACYAPAIVYALLVVGAARVTRIIGRYQTRWLEAVQLRVSFTSALLQSMRNIKLLGVSSVLKARAQGLRLKEIDECKRYRGINIAVILLKEGPSIFAPFATFLLYFLRARSSNQPLDIASAFSILTILRLVEQPLNALIYSSPHLVSALACFERIQQHLLADSRRDNRLSLQDVYDSNDYWDHIDQSGSMEMRRLSVTRSPADDALVLKNCSFGWKENSGAVLHDIDLSLRTGSTTMIIGPVGCGKSTLLRGMLSETPLSRGFVYLRNNSIAFGDQEPWIPNGTIREAIQGVTVGEVALDTEAWYEEVISCCGLAEDLKALDKRDCTVIGTKGISLSGGQKQRIALARAIYSKADIVMLDDVFSGLDTDTEDVIFRKLFSQSGPLRGAKTTVIMVTHAVHRLSHADTIVSLSQDGRITEQGNYVSLMKDVGGYVHSLDVRFKQQQQQLVLEEDAAPANLPESAKKPQIAAARLNADDIEEEDLIRRTGEWSTYQHWFKSAGYLSGWLSVLWCFVWMISVQMPGILVRTFSDQHGVSTTSASATVFIVLFGVSCASSVLGLLLCCWHILLDMQPRSAGGLHLDLLETVLNAPLSFFTRTDFGSILNRFGQDMTLVDSDLPFSYVDFVLALVATIVGFGLMAASGAGYFAATVPVVLAALYVVQKYYLRTSRQLRLLDLEEKAPLYTLFGETASGLASIRAFGWTEKFASRSLELLDRSQRPFYLMFCIQRWLSIVLDLIVTALVTILMTIVVLQRKSIEPAMVGLGLLSVISLNFSLTVMVRNWTQLETSIGAISRLRDFNRTTQSEHKAVEVEAVRSKWPENGEVAFNKFAASYSEDSTLVLKDIDLNVRLSEKIGVCGRSGSGKSSMLASLFHLLEYRSGNIVIDGVDIVRIPRETLRAKLNVIPQEPWWLTTETVRFNMDPWNTSHTEYSTPLDRDASFISALSRCQIWHIIQEKGGLDAVMTPDFLSHGQQQLFYLARAMVRQSKVVVLDEVSANVDVKTDHLMQQVIREHFDGCTVIAVAHRLNTIDDSDRVVVLSQGQIIETGDPARLLKTEGSRFKELYDA